MLNFCVVLCSILLISNCGRAELFYKESFDEDPFATGKWVKSSDEKYTGQPVMIKGSGKAAPGFEDDQGLSLTQEMKFKPHGIGIRTVRIVRNRYAGGNGLCPV